MTFLISWPDYSRCVKQYEGFKWTVQFIQISPSDNGLFYYFALLVFTLVSQYEHSSVVCRIPLSWELYQRPKYNAIYFDINIRSQFNKSQSKYSVTWSDMWITFSKAQNRCQPGWKHSMYRSLNKRTPLWLKIYPGKLLQPMIQHPTRFMHYCNVLLVAYPTGDDGPISRGDDVDVK